MSKIICITGSSGGIAKEIQTKLLQNDNIKVYGCSRKKFVLNIKLLSQNTRCMNQKSVSKWLKKFY